MAAQRKWISPTHGLLHLQRKRIGAALRQSNAYLNGYWKKTQGVSKACTVLGQFCMQATPAHFCVVFGTVLWLRAVAMIFNDDP